MSLSKCCHAEIEKRFGREYPDGPVFHIDTTWLVCSKCEDEYPLEVETCEECGEVAEVFGKLCKDCAHDLFEAGADA